MDMGSMHTAVEEDETGGHPSYFYLATEVNHLIVDQWTEDAIIDFVIVVVGAAFLSVLWQGLSRLARVLTHKLGYYAKLEAQLVAREQLQHRERSTSPSKRPAYLYHNGHVFHQSADYMELLEAHQERQLHLNTNTAAQVQRQIQRNQSLLDGSARPGSVGVEDEGEEDVFLDPNMTQNTAMTDVSGLSPRTLSDRTRSQSAGSRHTRNLSIDLDRNRWNSLQRTKKGYIGNHSRVGLKCYRFLYHCVMSVNHTLRFAIGYVLMLVVMTYNAWFLVAAVGGATIGYFLFSADLRTEAAKSVSAGLNRRIRRRQLENIRPHSFIQVHSQS